MEKLGPYITLDALPSEVLMKIFSNLDYEDLVSCSKVNHRLKDISDHDVHWKILCQKYWLLKELPPDMRWKDCFSLWYCDMGRYVDCYFTIKSAWNEIDAFMERNCPKIHRSIRKNGVTEHELDQAENKLKVRFPNELRCSFRIHNGQALGAPGLMGSMSIHGHFRSESLLDLDTAVTIFQDKDGVAGCLPLTFCLRSGLIQYIVLSSADGYETGTIFYPAHNLHQSSSNKRDAFISGKSFTEWFTRYSKQLANQDFVVLTEQPFKFYHEPSCELTTHFIKVSVATCFLPELSSVTPPHFFHTYRITLTMDPNAPVSASCQLETRHWIITDEAGNEETVDGPGVVGKHPIMAPGSTFSWVSCTYFSTTYGNMKGHFTMKNLKTGEICHVQCPVFHLKCLPYITASEREAIKMAQKIEKKIK